MSALASAVFVWMLWITTGISPMSYTEKLLSVLLLILLSDWIENNKR